MAPERARFDQCTTVGIVCRILTRAMPLKQAQYQRWQPRAKFKQSLDPTVEEVKKLCDSLRR